MKPEDDFGQMFVIVDVANKGYLTSEEVLDFYHSLFFNKVKIDLVDAVIRKVSKDEGCTLKHFQKVLLLIEEWRLREEVAYWDFKNLDRIGNDVLPLSDALLLAKSVKKEEFSLNEWNVWKNQNVTNASEISWNDFRHYLYHKSDKASSEKTKDSEIEVGISSLKKTKLNQAVDDFHFFKTSYETDEVVAAQLIRDKQWYHEDVQHEAHRLSNRWNVGGVEAVIYDDGAEWEAAEDQSAKDDVSIAQLMTILDEKYEILRDKLMWEMVRSKLTNDSANPKIARDKIEEEFMNAKSKEKDLRKSGRLEGELAALYGSDVIQNRDLMMLMGETADAYELRWEETQRRYAAYKSDGRTVKEINDIFEQENVKRIENCKTTSGKILIELWSRQQQEKQLILSKLKSASDGKERLVLYTSLYRQCERAREANNLDTDSINTINFEASAAGTGVAERKQVFEPERYSEDRIRQEMIASARLRLSKQRRKSDEAPTVGDKLKSVSQAKNLPAVDSWMEVMKLSEMKQTAEREMLMHFLHNIHGLEKSVQKLAEKEQNDRRNALCQMFGSWREEIDSVKKKETKASKRPYQLALLHEGLALYKEQVKREHPQSRPHEIASIILGRLQSLQDVQFQELHNQLRQKTPVEIAKIRKAEYRTIRDEHFVNIATLIFPAEKLSEEQIRLNAMILRKYDTLREKLFRDYIRNYHSNEDAEKLLTELKEEEAKSRNDRDQIRSLCKRLKISFSVMEIFGPKYSQFANAVAMNRNEKSVLSQDNLSQESGAEENILSALEDRYQDECSAVHDEIKTSNDSSEAMSSEMDEQLWQLATLDGDKNFLPAAVTMGVFQRIKLGRNEIRLREDTQRFARGAQDRFPITEPFNDQSASIYVSKSDEITAALQPLLRHHNDEWKRFRTLLTDVTADELREAASLMTTDERIKRLVEINSKRKTIDVSTDDGKEDLLFLLEEAAAIKHVIRKDLLRRIAGEEEARDEVIFTSLLADLHQEQLSDNWRWFNNASTKKGKEATELSSLIDKHMEEYENIFQILCKYEGAIEDDDLLQALDDKYDTLRDKLLSDALMRQIGEEEWRRMNERERQKRLMELKREERRLRREGKWDELARLLGDAFSNDLRMKKLLGESREDYERRLKEKLAARKRGEDVSDDEDEGDLEVKNGTHNPLLDLNMRLDDEKAALLKMLNDQDNLYMSEKERQAALLRLKQAQLRAAGEERYEAAALVSGLADRESAADKRLKSDKERQRELARRRLEELRNKRHLPTSSQDVDEVIRGGNRSLMEESVIKKLRFLQSWERAWLASLLNDVSSPFSVVAMMSSQQVTDKLSACQAKFPKEAAILDDHRPILSDAALYRQAVLARHVENNEQSRDEIKVTILAELQDDQDQEGKILSDKMADMDQTELIKEQENLVALIKSGSSKSVPKSLFITSSGVSSEDELADALKGKYDAAIDRVAAKAFFYKVGKETWDKMSSEEREAKTADLSSRVKELMNSGRYDDALDLLTEGLSEEEKEEIIDALLGDSEERRKFDLQERQKRMEQRIKDGMSPEEAQRLFDEEGLLFEEQEKKRRRNVLEGLAMDLESEKNALLKALQAAKNKQDAERKRQALLAKLRLQERLMRRDENFNSIGNLLAMSRDHDDALEKERRRQMKLAQERIDEIRRRRKEGTLDQADDVIDLRLDSDDVVVLADAVMREMEAKHASERKAMIELMEIVGPESDLRHKIAKYSSRECKNRTRELREVRRQWRNEDPQTLLETKDEHWEILKEAYALQITPLCNLKSVPEEDGQVYILADLQAEQKKETALLLAGLLEKNPATVRKMAEAQRMARLGSWHDNVATSLLGASQQSEKKAEEEEVVKALEDKYDALKDKLLSEALIKLLGDKKWAELNEKERQKRIAQIKQKEKKLRREGNYHELSLLFHNLAITEEDTERIFGKQRLSQEEALKKRKARIRELRSERAQQGLEINDEEIEQQVNTEEKAEKQKRTNILLTLDQNLEAEREALLSHLQQKEDSVSEERKRQLAVAQLRRQRRQLEAEEKISAIDYVLQSAKQDEDALSAQRAANRERQAELAMKRLASMKTQKQRKQAFASLTDTSRIYERLKSIAEEKSEGSSTEQLIYEMEKKHLDEKEFLTQLLLASEYDNSKIKQVKNMDIDSLNENLETFYANRRKWREERMMRAIAENGDDPLTERQQESLSRYVSEQNKLLIKALRHKIEVSSRENLDETDPDALRDKIISEWIGALNQTQENEIKTTADLIGDKSNEILLLLTQGQRRARREAWIDNIGKVVFELVLPGQEQQRPASSSSSLDQEIQKAEAETNEKIQDIDKEFLEVKDKIQRKIIQGEEIDSAAAFAALEKQCADKKAALTSGLDRQRQHIREVLHEKRQRRDESAYEAHAAAGMVLLAEQRLKARENQTKSNASKQKTLMQQRLAARKERRRKEQEKSSQETAPSTPEDVSVDKKKSPAPPPMPGLQREKTVIPVSITDNEKSKVLEELQSKTRQYQEKIEKEKADQQEQIQKRIREKQKRKTRADELLTTFQREETIVHERRSKSMERQKTMVIERIGKLKHERTMTMKENRNKKAQNFAKIMDDGESSGIDTNKKMEEVAEELQKKFMVEKLNIDEKQTGGDEMNKDDVSSSLPPKSSDLPPRPLTASRRLDEDERIRILKQKQRGTKNRRKMEIDNDPESPDN